MCFLGGLMGCPPQEIFEKLIFWVSNNFYSVHDCFITLEYIDFTRVEELSHHFATWPTACYAYALQCEKIFLMCTHHWFHVVDWLSETITWCDLGAAECIQTVTSHFVISFLTWDNEIFMSLNSPVFTLSATWGFELTSNHKYLLI